MDIDIAGARLLERFAERGFSGLVYDEPIRLSTYLRDRASKTGREPLADVASAITEAYALFLKHDEAGGIRIGFVAELDRAVFYYLPSIRRSDVQESTRMAREFLDLIRKRLAEYDPRKTYGT